MPVRVDAAPRPIREVRDLLAKLSASEEKLKEVTKDLGIANSYRKSSDKAARDANERAEKAEEQANYTAKEIGSKRTFARRSKSVAEEFMKHHASDVPRLVVAGIRRLAKKHKVDMTALTTSLIASREFADVRQEIFDLRDKQIAEHLPPAEGGVHP